MSENDQTKTVIDETGEGQESGPIKALRDQLKTEKAARVAAEARTGEVAASIRAEVKREQEASGVVSDLGYPDMASLIAEKVEGEVTVESATAFLSTLGLKPIPKDGSTDGAPKPDTTVSVGDVADLGSQVAAAASGTQETDVEKRLDAATSEAEIASIMGEAGLLKSL